MADETTGTTGSETLTGQPTTTQPAPQQVQAPAPANPAAAGQQAPAPTPEPTSNDQASDEEPFDRERALNTIRKLRGFEKIANQLERENAEFKRKDEEARLAQLSREEQLQTLLKQRDAEIAHERQVARDRTNTYEVQIQASRLGIVDPDAAAKLLDWGSLEYDTDGRPSDIAGALADLLAAKPYLKAQAPQAATLVPAPHTTVSPTNSASRPVSAEARRYSSAEISDRAFYLANRDDIILAMRQGRVDAS